MEGQSLEAGLKRGAHTPLDKAFMQWRILATKQRADVTRGLRVRHEHAVLGQLSKPLWLGTRITMGMGPRSSWGPPWAWDAGMGLFTFSFGLFTP